MLRMFAQAEIERNLQVGNMAQYLGNPSVNGFRGDAPQRDVRSVTPFRTLRPPPPISRTTQFASPRE